MDLELERKKLELKRVEIARMELELKIKEYEKEINRLKDHILIQCDKEIELKNIIGG